VGLRKSVFEGEAAGEAERAAAGQQADHRLQPGKIFPRLSVSANLIVLTPCLHEQWASDFCHVQAIFPGCLSDFDRLSNQF